MKNCVSMEEGLKKNKTISMEKEYVNLDVGYTANKVKYGELRQYEVKNIGKDGFTRPRKFI